MAPADESTTTTITKRTPPTTIEPEQIRGCDIPISTGRSQLLHPSTRIRVCADDYDYNAFQESSLFNRSLQCNALCMCRIYIIYRTFSTLLIFFTFRNK